MQIIHEAGRSPKMQHVHKPTTRVSATNRSKVTNGSRLLLGVDGRSPQARRSRAPPAALFYASRDRRHEHPVRHLNGFSGILQADAYGGYNELYEASRPQGPITPALCWAHARRQFFELADIAANARRGNNATAISPIALEAVRRIDLLFDIERGINGQSAEQRLLVRKEQSAPLLATLEGWLREQRARLSNSSAVAKPIDYMLRRWGRFARFIDDGRICLTNNAAERALRGFALGRNSWLFAGSERGADRAAVMATLIVTANLNDIDPQAWLADVLARIADAPQGQLQKLLPWEWNKALAYSAAQPTSDYPLRPKPEGYGVRGQVRGGPLHGASGGAPRAEERAAAGCRRQRRGRGHGDLDQPVRSDPSTAGGPREALLSAIDDFVEALTGDRSKLHDHGHSIG